MLKPPLFIAEEMIKRNMSKDRLAELLNIRRPKLNSMLDGSRRIDREKMKKVFPNLSKQIDNHRVCLSCPICGFGVRLKKNSVHCLHCCAFIIKDTLSEAISKWNERYKQRKVSLVLRCPICGGEPDINCKSVKCGRCDFTVPSIFGRSTKDEELIKFWNRRYRI